MPRIARDHLNSGARCARDPRWRCRGVCPDTRTRRETSGEVIDLDTDPARISGKRRRGLRRRTLPIGRAWGHLCGRRAGSGSGSADRRRAALTERQPGRASVERPDPGFVIDAEGDRLVRWVEVEPDGVSARLLDATRFFLLQPGFGLDAARARRARGAPHRPNAQRVRRVAAGRHLDACVNPYFQIPRQQDPQMKKVEAE